ncbi:MAG: PadR family transcriptional regulator [Solirubrobacteraceae bacterium]|jgi:DNA-binding PadR family transcriptional regulator
MRSPLNWALLGLVIQRPSYGYELVQRFERIYEDALELSSPSQVYTALDALRRRSLIEELPAEEAPGVVRQPKPHYQATTDGVRGYQEWLIAHVCEERRRSRLFARQVAMLASADALVVVERCEQACLREAAHTRPADPHAEEPTDLATRLVDEEERLAVDARLAWVAYARRQLTTPAARATPRRRP